MFMLMTLVIWLESYESSFMITLFLNTFSKCLQYSKFDIFYGK
jgi:hypothetical protein